MAGESGGGGGFNTSFGDISLGLFGSDSTVGGSGTKTVSSAQSSVEVLEVDKEGITQLINNLLKDTGGLAEIFSDEQLAGLFGSTVAKKGTEDLLAKISGELALLTGAKLSSSSGIQDTDSTSTETTKSDGLVDKVLSIF